MNAKGILGGLVGLFVGASLLYGASNFDYASRAVEDTQGSVRRTVQRVDLDNPLERVTAAGHDVGQRNFGRAVSELEQWSPSYASTPKQSRIRAGYHTQNGHRLLEGLEDISESEWTNKDLPFNLDNYGKMGGLIVGGLLGLGALSYLSSRKKSEPQKETK